MEKMELPRIPSAPPHDVPRPALAFDDAVAVFRRHARQARECKQAYYAAISFVDAQIGKLLDAMDRLQALG